MKKLLGLTILSTILSTSMAFAGDTDKTDDPSCTAIAKACKSAGYSHKSDQKFWQGCMRPLLLG